MTQIFFISPNGAAAVKEALKNVQRHSQHGWRPDGDDKQVIGVVEVGHGDAEAIACALEAAGILVLPDHRTAVCPTDTTKQAMHKIHSVSGFPPLKPKRFV
jgi:hypothetical protein